MNVRRCFVKFLSMLLMITGLSSVLFFDLPVKATGTDVILVVGNAQGARGDRVFIELYLAENPGITIFQPQISFDNTKLELKSVTNGNGILNQPTHNLTAMTIANTAGAYNFLWYDALAFENNVSVGLIATLEFEIKDYTLPSGADIITLGVVIAGCLNNNLTTAPHQIQSGGGIITVLGNTLLGDINNDNETNDFDLTLLEKHLLKIELIENDARKAADMNNDKNIDILDILLLKEYILLTTAV